MKVCSSDPLGSLLRSRRVKGFFYDPSGLAYKDLFDLAIKVYSSLRIKYQSGAAIKDPS